MTGRQADTGNKYRIPVPMLTENTIFYLGQMARSIWFRPAIYALAAGCALVLGPFFDPYVPEKMYSVLRENAVKDILTIIASSMLAVAIFSLGTMVSAFQVAAEAATPRARPLVMQDRTAQNAISTFLGAFLFSILGIIGLSAQLFSGGGRMVLFVLSILLIVLVIGTFIAWMQRLAQLGGVSEVIDQVEKATSRGFANLADAPYFGGHKAKKIPKTATAIPTRKYGYIQHIDVRTLGSLADELETDFHLTVRPGAFVHPERPLLFISKKPDEKTVKKLQRAFVIGDQRTFQTDPLYGLIVLSEIASRALSPGINDPGTAIDVLGTEARILGEWRRGANAADPESKWERLYVADLEIDGILDAAFSAIIRDGAGQYEVILKLLQTLNLLIEEDKKYCGDHAQKLFDRALELAEADIESKDEIRLLKERSKLLIPADPSR